MSSRSWVRALNASAAIAINCVNYAYLISFIQFGIAPTHIRLAVADFLTPMRYPYLPLGVCSTRLILIGSWLSSPAQVHHGISCSHPHTTCVLPQLYIFCKIIRLCTYHPIRPPTTYPLLVLLWTIIGFRVPVGCCILARPFRFSGLIHLLIWVFLCESMHYFSLVISFAATSQNIFGLYNGPHVLGVSQLLRGRRLQS